MPPPLGWIPPADRTPDQAAAHAAAVATMPRFAIPGAASLSKGESVRLYDSWSAPAVVADIGFVFSRFHQITGSCVGAGGGCALFTLIAIQRLLALNPTKAILPWWPLDYGISRQLAGMRGQGSGSFGSTFAKAVTQGVLPAGLSGLPTFKDNDGLMLTEQLELKWSDGAAIDREWIDQAKVHVVGTAAELHSADDCEAALVNGYPITIACDQFVGRGSVQGSGKDACVVGRFDNSGGHQTSLQAVWNHPDLGRQFLYLNQWDGSTYPKDPSGAPECSVWISEAEVEKAIKRLGGELYAFSHLNWFPSQPEVLSWFA